MARTAIHPGEHLADELKALGMSAAALSRDINVPVNRITGIINGTRAITADTAIRLGHWFGTSAEFWLNLQKIFELRLAEQESKSEIEKLPRAAYRLTYKLMNGSKLSEESLWPMQKALDRGRQVIKCRGA